VVSTSTQSYIIVLVLRRAPISTLFPYTTLFRSGVFANTDRQAYMVMKILKERGIRIPEDVQILGFDGIRKYGIDEGALFVSSMRSEEHTSELQSRFDLV